jgi:ubiquinone/menaquinone biosynthesis C-methylase UbiE
LDQAENKAKKHLVENNVKFLEMNALDMQFIDNEFDYVLMSDVLEHIPHTDILMKESLRVLKK